MAQTPLNYNSLMTGRNGQPFTYKTGTVTGSTDLVKGQVVVLDTGKYRAAVDADKATDTIGWRILLADAAVSDGDVDAPLGNSGAVDTRLLVGTGLTIDDTLSDILAMNNIYTFTGTDAVQIAGEDA